MALTEVTSKGIKDVDIATADIADDAITQAKIADESVNEAKIQISNSGSNGQFLSKQTGNTGGLTWATVDTTIADNAITLAKMAGGTDGQIITYDANGDPVAVGPGTDGQVLTSTGAGSPPAFENNPAAVGGATGLDFNDGVKTRWGTGNDLEIYHSSNVNWIDAVNNHGTVLRAGTGILYLQGSEIHMGDEGGNEVHIKTIDNGAVELYHDNSKKLETNSEGVTITGAEGGDGSIYLSADEGDDNADKWTIQAKHASSTFTIQNNNGGAWDNSLKCHGDGGVELYYDNTKHFETCSDGLNFVGGNADQMQWQKANNLLKFRDGTKAVFGEGSDFQMYHSGSHSYITNATGKILIEAKAGETSIECEPDEGVKLFHNNAKKYETTTAGNKFLGDLTIHTGGSSQINFFDVDTATITNYTSSTALRWWDAVNSDAIMELAQNGNVNIDGQYYTNGVDYAEYFEAKNGGAIPVGTTVVLDNGKVRAATDSETPIGVIRPKTSGTSVTGGRNEFRWQGKYLVDDYDGELVETGVHCTWEEGNESKQCWKDRPPTGVTIPADAVETKRERRKLNPSFDESKTYVPRSERTEWNCVGLLGQIPITKGQPTASNWIKMKERSATVELWFVK